MAGQVPAGAADLLLRFRRPCGASVPQFCRCSIRRHQVTDAKESTGFDIYPLMVVLILSATVLQRIALPGTSNALPVSTIVLPAIAFYAWFTGRTRLVPLAFLFWLGFVLTGLGSFMMNASWEPVSLLSLCLIAVVQAPLMFRLSPGTDGAWRGLLFFVDLMFWLGLLGAVQFFGQGIVGQEIAFFMDFFVPAELKLEQLAYNSLNELYYEAGIYKSNGLFFTEPSFFCQFLAIAIIIELGTRKRIWCLAGLSLGMLCTYSGTGLIVLGVFGALLVASGRSRMLLLGGLVVAVVLVLYGEALQLSRFTSRIEEFSTPDTSGHARFVSIFYLLSDFSFDGILTTLFGRGPGTVMQYFHRMPFEAHSPTWGKALFEYGVIGAVFYVLFLKSGSYPWKSPLTAPIFLTYLVMGGYLGDATILTLLFTFLILGPRHWDRYGVEPAQVLRAGSAQRTPPARNWPSLPGTEQASSPGVEPRPPA